MAVNESAALPVHDASHVAEARRAASRLADRLGFSESRSGTVALVATELATNLVKHGRGGEMLVRPLADDATGGPPSGVEILALDRGPGIPDVALSRRDGHSTTGTPGNGLGAIERQADLFEIYTQPSGTVALARVWREPPGPRHPRSRFEIGAAHVSKPEEDICGDEWAFAMRDGRMAIFVADGLGHGLAAHDAARQAVDVFSRTHEETPQRVIEDVHAALRSTRGAAAAMVAVDPERGVARYCGVGNITGVIVTASGARHHLVSLNGTAGHTVPRFQEFTCPAPADAIVVMHSDGLGTHWDLGSYPGLRARRPSIIAGALYRDHSRRRDDVTVVVAKARPAQG